MAKSYFVRFDDNPEAAIAGSRRAAQHANPCEEEQPDPFDLCRILLAHLTELPDCDLLYLMDRVRGLSYQGSADHRGVAPSTIHLHIKKASARLPWIACFTGMKTTQSKYTTSKRVNDGGSGQ